MKCTATTGKFCVYFDHFSACLSKRPLEAGGQKKKLVVGTVCSPAPENADLCALSGVVDISLSVLSL